MARKLYLIGLSLSTFEARNIELGAERQEDRGELSNQEVANPIGPGPLCFHTLVLLYMYLSAYIIYH